MRLRLAWAQFGFWAFARSREGPYTGSGWRWTADFSGERDPPRTDVLQAGPPNGWAGQREFILPIRARRCVGLTALPRRA